MVSKEVTVPGDYKLGNSASKCVRYIRVCISSAFVGSHCGSRSSCGAVGLSQRRSLTPDWLTGGSNCGMERRAA
jgi:hypothetical protein